MKAKRACGVTNFRDMGGIKTKDGRTIKEGYLFRSSLITEKNDPKDIAYLSSLGVQQMVDLRDTESVVKQPELVLPGAKYVHTDVLASISPEASGSPIALDDIVVWDKNLTHAEYRKAYEVYLRLYRSMPFCRNGFLPIFEAMNRHEKVFFNCFSGKDRTGVAAMLIELALGVGDQEIEDDYHLSNYYRKQRNRWRLRLKWQQTHSLYGVVYQAKFAYTPKKYIRLSLRSIRAKYPDVLDFYEKEYGISPSQIEDWKSFYLKP